MTTNKIKRLVEDSNRELTPISGSTTDYMSHSTRLRLAYMDTQEGEFPSHITQGPKYDRLILVIPSPLTVKEPVTGTLEIAPPNEDDRRPVIFPLAKKVNCAAE